MSRELFDRATLRPVSEPGFKRPTAEFKDYTPNKLYVIVDASLSPGQKAAQAVHAAAEFMIVVLNPTEDSPGDPDRDADRVLRWHHHNPTVIVLEHDDLETLDVVLGDFTDLIHSFREPDLQWKLTSIACFIDQEFESFLGTLPLACSPPPPPDLPKPGPEFEPPYRPLRPMPWDADRKREAEQRPKKKRWFRSE